MGFGRSPANYWASLSITLSSIEGPPMEAHDPRLKRIWKQVALPVIYRRTASDPVLIRLPYAAENFEWIRGDNKRKPEWNSQYRCWEAPAAWFDRLIKRALEKYKKTYVIQQHKHQQKCAPACWNAKGFHCECSCMGQHHGAGHPGGRWHEVAETFAFQWGEKQYACRLITSTASTAI